jgi:integrase/recombinase XerD
MSISHTALMEPLPGPLQESRDLNYLIDVILKSPLAPSTKARYRRDLRLFLAWWVATGRQRLSGELVLEYAGALRDAGKRPFQIGHALSAIKTLARAAAVRRWIDGIDLDSILHCKGPKVHATKLGNWLTADDIPELMALPDRTTRLGKRDYVILGLLLYGGLRATEAAGIRFEHLQVRDGRPVLVDFVGKGEKPRSVAIPAELFYAIQDWVEDAGLTDGYLIRSLEGHARKICTDTPLARVNIWKVVKKYAAMMGRPDIAPHDLRRTKARVSRDAGVALDQIQADLGHSSVTTTQKYVGSNQDFRNAPCDALPGMIKKAKKEGA